MAEYTVKKMKNERSKDYLFVAILILMLMLIVPIVNNGQ